MPRNARLSDNTRSLSPFFLDGQAFLMGPGPGLMEPAASPVKFSGQDGQPGGDDQKGRSREKNQSDAEGEDDAADDSDDDFSQMDG